MAQRQESESTYPAGLCRRNALHVVKLAWTTHPRIGFDAAGVRWLDSYIEQQWEYLPDGFADEFVQFMGCFYGEILIATFGGSWQWSGDRLGIYSDALGFTFPFAAVARQLQRGPSASVATAYFTAVEYRFAPTGTVELVGAKQPQADYPFAPVGTVELVGARQPQAEYPFAPVGTVELVGARQPQAEYPFAPVGTVELVGAKQPQADYPRTLSEPNRSRSRAVTSSG